MKESELRHRVMELYTAVVAEMAKELYNQTVEWLHKASEVLRCRTKEQAIEALKALSRCVDNIGYQDIFAELEQWAKNLPEQPKIPEQRRLL
jgi:ribonuclease HIII